jgi:hypothetical protein
VRHPSSNNVGAGPLASTCRADEQAAAHLGQVDRPGTRMARIAVRPAWVGLIDFDTRLPEAISG